VGIGAGHLQRGAAALADGICAPNLPVVLAIGCVEPGARDTGPAHTPPDLQVLCRQPNMTVMLPADGAEFHRMLSHALQLGSPVAVHYPCRGADAPGGAGMAAPGEAPITGRAQVCRRGRQVALLAFGTAVAPALTVGDHLDTTVLNMRFLKPLDTDAVLRLARTHALLVSLEPSTAQGAAGSALREALAAAGETDRLLHLEWPCVEPTHAGAKEALLRAIHAGLGARRCASR
jgi:1-deoxy-D-xylulose-5-phosphate synthase